MDIDETVTMGRTLARTGQGGDEDIVKLLLQLGNVKADWAGMGYGGIPLWWAAKAGHEGVAK